MHFITYMSSITLWSPSSNFGMNSTPAAYFGSFAWRWPQLFANFAGFVYFWLACFFLCFLLISLWHPRFLLNDELPRFASKHFPMMECKILHIILYLSLIITDVLIYKKLLSRKPTRERFNQTLIHWIHCFSGYTFCNWFVNFTTKCICNCTRKCTCHSQINMNICFLFQLFVSCFRIYPVKI